MSDLDFLLVLTPQGPEHGDVFSRFPPEPVPDVQSAYSQWKGSNGHLTQIYQFKENRSVVN